MCVGVCRCFVGVDVGGCVRRCVVMQVSVGVCVGVNVCVGVYVSVDVGECV